MGEIRVTTKGKIALAILIVLAIVTAVLGTIYFAIYMFVFFTAALGITLYEAFFNK